MEVTFYNWSDTAFTYNWDSKSFTFLPGSVSVDFLKSDDGSKLIMDRGIAEHFARHLANREADKKGVDLGMVSVLEEFMGKALSLPEVAPVVVEAAVEPVEVVTSEESTESVEVAENKRGRRKQAEPVV